MNRPKLIIPLAGIALLAAAAVLLMLRSGSGDHASSDESGRPASVREAQSSVDDPSSSPAGSRSAQGPQLSAEERARLAAETREAALALLEDASQDRDMGEAIRLLQESAAMGDVESMRHLAYLSEKGIGMAKDPAKAFDWYLKAAELGDAEAMYHLADYLDGGKGVGENFTFAAEWYREAGEMGVADAWAKLGQLYAAGKGVEQDFEQAMQMYAKATAAGSGKGLLYEGLAHLEGWGVAKDVDRGIDLLLQSANAGDRQAQYALFKLYSNGDYVPVDQQAADEWLRKAIEGGDPNAMKERARMLVAGDSIDSILEGVALFSEAAGLDDGAAARELAEATLRLEKNYDGLTKAMAFAQAAASMGDEQANFLLAYYAAESGSRTDPGSQRLSDLLGEGESWLRRGAEAGDARAKLALQLMERKEMTAIEAIRAANRMSRDETYREQTRVEVAKNRTAPRLVSAPTPRFPQALELQDYSGQVLLECMVGADGSVTQIRAVNEDHPALVQNAIAAVERWKFEPALRDGKPVPTRVRVPVQFGAAK